MSLTCLPVATLKGPAAQLSSGFVSYLWQLKYPSGWLTAACQGENAWVMYELKSQHSAYCFLLKVSCAWMLQGKLFEHELTLGRKLSWDGRTNDVISCFSGFNFFCLFLTRRKRRFKSLCVTANTINVMKKCFRANIEISFQRKCWRMRNDFLKKNIFLKLKSFSN